MYYSKYLCKYFEQIFYFVFLYFGIFKSIFLSFKNSFKVIKASQGLSTNIQYFDPSNKFTRTLAHAAETIALGRDI